MWFGMRHLPGSAAAGESEQVLLMIWKPGWHRPIRIGSPAEAVGECIRFARAIGEGAAISVPRCDACGASIDLPDLDTDIEEEACPSP